MGRVYVAIYSTAHASLSSLQTTVAYSYVLYIRLKTAPLLPVTRPPKLCITGGQIRRSKKSIFLSKFARYIRRGTCTYIKGATGKK